MHQLKEVCRYVAATSVYIRAILEGMFEKVRDETGENMLASVHRAIRKRFKHVLFFVPQYLLTFICYDIQHANPMLHNNLKKDHIYYFYRYILNIKTLFHFIILYVMLHYIIFIFYLYSIIYSSIFYYQLIVLVA